MPRKTAEAPAPASLTLDRLVDTIAETHRHFAAQAGKAVNIALTLRNWAIGAYVTWYARHMMSDGDNPPIGIPLCTQKDHALVDYALAGMDNQLFVSRYQLELPSKEVLQRFLEQQLKDA